MSNATYEKGVKKSVLCLEVVLYLEGLLLEVPCTATSPVAPHNTCMHTYMHNTCMYTCIQHINCYVPYISCFVSPVYCGLPSPCG